MSHEPGTIDATAAAGFGAGAADYDLGRPGYPAEVVGVLGRALGLGPGSEVLDLAAGTGKFTRLLVDAGARVTAVEPVAAMRARLAAGLPGVTVLDGPAEAIPLATASFDAVCVAQAFHWFRADEALAEIRRVLRPAGGLAVVYNERDEGTPWVAALTEAIEWDRLPVPDFRALDWAGILGAAGFAPPSVERIRWAHAMTAATLEARVRSISYIAAMPVADQDRFVERALALVVGFAEPFDFPYETLVVCARRR